MKLFERLRQAVKKPSNPTEASSEPTTTTEEAGGQTGAAAVRLVATHETAPPQDPRRTQAEQATRAAMTAESVAETVHSRAAYETERRRKCLAQWLGEHPRPRWFLFWLRPRWNARRVKLQRAIERQERRAQRARRAQEAAQKDYTKKRQRLTALSAKPYTPPMPSAPRERVTRVLVPTPPAAPEPSLAARLRLAGVLPALPKAAHSDAGPRSRPPRPGKP